MFPNSRTQLAVSHAGALAVVTVACKAHRLIVGYAHATVAAKLGSLACDVSFLLAYAALWAWLLGRPRLGAHFVLPVRVSTLLLVGCALVDHGFFLETGATLDWHIARYAVSHAGELIPILAHEGRKLALTSTFVVGIALLPEAIGRLPFVKRALARAKDARPFRRSRWTAPALYASLLAPGALVLTSATAASFDVSSHNVYLRLGKGAVRDLTRSPSRGAGATSQAAQRLTEARPDRHYNAVIVVLESARARSFSPYAPAAKSTPFFERLARSGALVETAYTVVPHTTKSLVSIQCGIYPRLDPEPYEADEKGIPTRCLADLLRGAGYATAFFQPAESNFERRRELVDQFGYETFAGRQSLPSKGFDESNYLGLEDKAMLRPIMAWVDAQREPFLLSVLTLTSHHPYAPPLGFKAERRSDNALQSDYENTLAYTDEFLGQLHGEFERRGLLDRTIFVVLGDHGEGMGEHGAFIHDAVPYEEGLRVPMALAGPGIEPGRRVAGLRQNIDVAPTLLEALGFDLEARSSPGRSLLSSSGHERLYFACHYRDYCLATRDARRKLIHHYGRRPPELFDLIDDPEERRDLAGSDALGSRTFIDDLERWKWRVNAQFTEGREWRLTRDVSAMVPPVEHAVGAALGTGVRLLGYDVDRQELAIGEQATITHYFQVTGPLDPRQRLVFRLEGPRGEDLSHSPVQGSYPTSRWRPGEYVTDRFVYFARPGTPPGSYRLTVDLEDRPPADRPSGPPDGERRAVETARWTTVPDRLDESDYVYAAPPPGFTAQRAPLSPELELYGCRLSKGEVKRGIRTTLSCLYRVLADRPRLRLCTELDGPTSKVIDHAPVRGVYPPSEWKAGQYVADEVDLYLYNGDPDGEYRISVGVERAPEDDEPLAGCTRPSRMVDVATLTLRR